MIPVNKKVIKVEKKDTGFVIGESPKLVINLETGEHWIFQGDWKIPYKKKVAFSEDLLEGNRRSVLETAIRYHYEKACEIARNTAKAEAYRRKI